MKSKDDQKAYKGLIKCPPAAPVCADCDPKHPCPQGVIFNCCTGAGLGTLVLLEPVLDIDIPVSVVCAAIDTTCLCKPVVNVRFDCIVTNSIFAGGQTGIVGTLTFRLKKSCDSGQEIECGTWMYTRDNNFLFENTSFGFAFCDCNPCPGCCTYAVELVSVNDEGAANVTLAIQGPTLQVEAVEACGDARGGCASVPSFCAAAGTIERPKGKCPPAAPVCADCRPKHPCPQGAVFNCCTGAGIPTTSACPSIPRSLVCVTVDTTCLCKPLVVLDFSAVIGSVFQLQGELLGLVFQVKKTCDDGQEIVCGNWSFTINVIQALTRSDSFKFTFCDCNPCPGCCTYSVELVSCSIANPVFQRFSIEAPTAAVIAVDTCPQ